MMKRLKFYREMDGRWYVDLPEWKGGKSALEMVVGADTMLFIMAEGKDEVALNISEEHFDNSDELIFLRLADDIGEGAYYHIEKYRGVAIELEMWLCNVVLFVFENRFPKKLFISVEE